MKIPKLFHQIWFGDNIPQLKQKWLNGNKKKLESEGGWTYKLWQSKDLNLENFPQTLKYILKALKLKRYAMAADLARYEILYIHGGVYMDANMELQQKRLTTMLNRAFKYNKTLIVAHEDKDVVPLHASIQITKGGKTVTRKYISNGFIAVIPKHIALKRATDRNRLNKINWRNKMINQETGPFYWRESIKDNDIKNILVLKTKEIYPFSLYHTFGYGKNGESNNKCISKLKSKNSLNITVGNGVLRYITVPCAKYTQSYSVDHFNAGGTWIK
jgi:mannosyltransferase OCH1-like enzyme